MRFALWVLGTDVLSVAWGPEGGSEGDVKAGDDRLPPMDVSGPCADCESPRIVECLWCRRPYCRAHARDHHCPEMESEARIVDDE